MEEFLETRPQPELDILILDMGLKKISGLDFLIGYQKSFHHKTIVLSSVCTDDVVLAALKYGASSYLWKSDLYSINDAIDIVLSGGSVITSTIAAKVLQHFQDARLKEETQSALWESLTHRERQILELILDGESTEEIAGLFQITIATVRQQIKSIYKKFHVNSKTELVLKSRRG